MNVYHLLGRKKVCMCVCVVSALDTNLATAAAATAADEK